MKKLHLKTWKVRVRLLDSNKFLSFPIFEKFHILVAMLSKRSSFTRIQKNNVTCCIIHVRPVLGNATM